MLGDLFNDLSLISTYLSHTLKQKMVLIPQCSLKGCAFYILDGIFVSKF